MPAAQKTVLVTGCSAGGIGAAIARALAKDGHNVYATARVTSKIPTELSGLSNVTTLELNVTSPISVQEAAKAVAAGGKGLDVLVNNAGSGLTMRLLDVDVEQAQRVHDTNLWGSLRTVQAFADLLIESQGRVVNVSTVGAAVNTPWIGRTKHTLGHATTRALPFKVSVVTIMVGTVATPFHANEPLVVLPPSSRYAAIRDTISRWATGEAEPKGGSAQELTESLVQDIIGQAKPVYVWKGANSWTVKFVSSWVPSSMLNGMMATGQGLDKLA